VVEVWGGVGGCWWAIAGPTGGGARSGEVLWIHRSQLTGPGPWHCRVATSYERRIRWVVVVAVAAAVGLQVALPNRFTPRHRAVPVLELVVADRADRGQPTSHPTASPGGDAQPLSCSRR